jgi:myo-inositol-1(or 4)-monophosphatase
MDGIFERLAFAHRLADAAGAAILPYFRTRIDVTDKGEGAFDPVTEADAKAETIIRDMIGKEFPADAILGEEFGDTKGTSGFRWVIDPLDGTRAFITGQPLWGTLIALEKNGAAIAGVLDQPFLRERFIGAQGKTELRDGSGTRTLKARPCAALKDAVVSTTHPLAHFSEAERALFTRVEKDCRLSRYGGDCYAYALLAMGFIDLVIEAGLKPWDAAALVPIVEGAGGIVSDWNGKSAHGGGTMIAAGDARVHEAALALLSAG